MEAILHQLTHSLTHYFWRVKMPQDFFHQQYQTTVAIEISTLRLSLDYGAYRGEQTHSRTRRPSSGSWSAATPPAAGSFSIRFTRSSGRWIFCFVSSQPNVRPKNPDFGPRLGGLSSKTRFWNCLSLVLFSLGKAWEETWLLSPNAKTVCCTVGGHFLKSTWELSRNGTRDWCSFLNPNLGELDVRCWWLLRTPCTNTT